MDLRIDRDYVTEVLRALVRIDSVNPSLVPGAAGEAEAARYVAGSLRAIGMEVTVHEPEPGRPSVVGTLGGSGGGRSLMLNAHYDTVGVDGMTDPFSAEIRGERLFGRGAYDMKGSLAACIGAAHALRTAGVCLAGDLLIAAVADEEHASLGTFDIASRYAVDGAIVTEPTSLRLCLAHKGFVWVEVVTHGRAAHGSRPDLGIDANLRMGRVLSRLEVLEGEVRARRSHPLVGPGSLHAALLRGGTGLSTYAAECRMGIERRTIPGETVAQVMAELNGLLDGLRAEDPSLDVSIEMLLARDPFEARPDSPLAATVSSCAARLLGAAPRRVGETPWMDSAILAAAGVDTVVMGPHGAGAHAAEEWVDLDSVHSLAEILARTALEFCAGPEETREAAKA
jgi:acetylornithine deacetylase